MKTILGIFFPFICTTIGASAVFLLKNKINHNYKKILLGFSSGIMIASAIWSLILPSLEITSSPIPTAIGFTFGIIFMFLVNYFYPEKQDASNNQMILAMIIHNIPEGIAVGIAFAGALSDNLLITISGALSLSIGIAIQNIPEGAIISLPLKYSGITKFKSFLVGMLSRSSRANFCNYYHSFFKIHFKFLSIFFIHCFWNNVLRCFR